MSEQSMKYEDMDAPMQRAVAYLEMQQKARKGKIPRVEKKGEAAIRTDIIPAIPKVRRAEPLVQSVTAYEEFIDNLKSEKAKQAFEKLRPTAYKVIEGTQWGARIADVALSVFLWLPRSPIPSLIGKTAATWGMWRFRPVEWAAEQGTKMGLSVARPIADLILRGGEPKAEMPASAPKPAVV